MRAVRLADSIFDDIRRQVPEDRVDAFLRHDLRPLMDALGEHVEHGPGRRLSLRGRTVAGFHLFGLPDAEDPREGAIVIYLIDVWLDDFPD